MRLPPKNKRPGHEAYPMPDRQHVAAALGFAKMHHPGDTALMSRLRAKAHRKFPGSAKARGGHVHIEGFRHEGHKTHHRADKARRG